ncbi:MAG: hypothetical protein Q7U74_07910, partial [Saprospiraceae bacterium]|nr:hypothetical protein [Saprospiraceae bacterium]
SANKVKTEVGVFTLNCKHRHLKDKRISLLLKQSEEGMDEIKLKVEDVFFDREQFQVKTKNGIVVQMKDAPRIGQIIRVKVQVECLA